MEQANNEPSLNLFDEDGFKLTGESIACRGGFTNFRNNSHCHMLIIKEYFI